MADQKKRAPTLDQSGLYGGQKSLEYYTAWCLHDCRTLDTFGCAWVELPDWLRHDLLVLMSMERWHEFNAGLPSPETTPHSASPFDE